MQLTKNFNISEFKCKCGCAMPLEVLHNLQKLANQLQIIRNAQNVPIKINSAYRCEKHNKKIGSNNRSQHILGKAADVVISGKTPKETADLIEDLISKGEILQGGLGLYKTFTHYDIRKTKARW